jgi:hypothetical protein
MTSSLVVDLSTGQITPLLAWGMRLAPQAFLTNPN